MKLAEILGQVGRGVRNVPVLLFGRPMHGEERYQPFFIIGSGRCGTTLLRAMLQAHPAVHIPPETYELWRITREFKIYSRLPADVNLRMILGALGLNWYFDAFEISLIGLYHELREIPPKDVNLAYILNAFYMYHARQHKPTAVRWGDKTPLNTFHIDRILKVFPDARFIHMLRDGRDVVRSYVKLGRYSIEDAAARWRRAVTESRAFGQRRPDAFLEVKYEELVADPEATIRGVCEFIDLDFQPDMLRHHELEARLGDVDRLDHHANVKRAITTDIVGKWREYFDESEVARLQTALGSLLQEAGYR